MWTDGTSSRARSFLDSSFAAAAAFVDKSQLANRAAVELLARGAGVGVFKAKQEIPAGGLPYLPTSGQRMHSGADGTNTADPELAAIEAHYRKAKRGG